MDWRPAMLAMMIATAAVVPAFAQTCTPATAPNADASPAFFDSLAVNADLVQRSRSSPTQLAACTLSHLAARARARALIGTPASENDETQRQRNLAALSIVYLKLRMFASAADRTAIEPWLVSIADAASAAKPASAEARAWQALALAASAEAAHDDALWSAAMAASEAALSDAGADAEPARGDALTALLPLSELARSRGVDVYAMQAGALHSRVEAALGDLRSGKVEGGGAGWIALYKRRFPERAADAPYQTARHRALGGDVTVLVGVLEKDR